MANGKAKSKRNPSFFADEKKRENLFGEQSDRNPPLGPTVEKTASGRRMTRISRKIAFADG